MTMLRLEQLEYLRAVARFGSVKLAAEALMVSPSTISMALHKIEKDSGMQVLAKSYHGMELTSGALEIVGKADEIFEKMDEIDAILELHSSRQKNHQDKQKMSVYLSRGYYQGGLSTFLQLFSAYGVDADFPDVSRGNETYLQYVNEDPDSVLCNYFVEPSGELLNQYPNVESIRINSSAPCIICSKNYPIPADKTELTVGEALKLPYLVFNEGYDLALPILEMLEEHGKIQIAGKFSNVTVMSTMLAKGTGVAVSVDYGKGMNDHRQEIAGKGLLEHYRIIPIKCDMRISMILCFNRKLSAEKRKILYRLAREF